MMEQQSDFFTDLLYLLSVTGIEDAHKVFTYLIPIVLSWFIYKKVKARRDLLNQATEELEMETS